MMDCIKGIKWEGLAKKLKEVTSDREEKMQVNSH